MKMGVSELAENGAVRPYNKDLRRQAEEELKQERRREQVDKIKAELRLKKPLWHKIFPWKLTLTKR